MKISLFKKLKEQHIPKQAYFDYKSDISHYNLNTLNQICWVGMIGGIILVLVSLPPLRLLNLLSGYVGIAVLFAIMVLLTNTLLKKHSNLVLPIYYIFIFILLAIGIVMGTFLSETTNAVTFVMLIITLPLFIIDRPCRLNLLFGLMCVAFCVVDCTVKSGKLLHMDISNCIVFYLLSVVISRQSINVKLSDIIIKHELKKQRDEDMLTKLNNRGAFERLVDQYIHTSNKNAVMLIMDLDNFKSVNDTMGHEYGDLVLKLVGEYIKECFRSGDIFSRLGGDEFVAFLPAVNDLSVIIGKVDSLIKKISNIQQELHLKCTVGVSVGLAQYPIDGCSFQELYRRADIALYSAKQKGKGTYSVYNGKKDSEQ